MRKIFIVGLFVIMNFHVNAQMQLPNRVKVWFPSYIQNSREMDNSKWMAKIQNEEYGKETGELWVAYSDRKQSKTYSSPTLDSPTGITLDFKEQVIIANIKKGFALIYTEGSTQPNYPIIGSDAKCKGWIPLDNLLLWDKCPMDKYNVFQKAVVLKDIKSNAKGDISPFFLNNPDTKTRTGLPANDLEFYFVFKKQKIEGVTYYLLAKEWDIKNSTGQINNLYGWMDDGNVTSWDNRVCFEPVNEKRAVDFFNQQNTKPKIFSESASAANYFKDGQGSEAKVIWELEGKLTTKRQDPVQIRFPLIEDKGNILNVATIGNIGDGNGSRLSQDKKNELTKRLEEFVSKKNNGNIIFVIDGTISMKKYYEPLAKAIEQSRYSTKLNDKQRFKFGAVVYRDYMDGNRLIETKPLTSDFDEVSGFINRCEAKQESGDASYEEAMFKGLITASEMLDENNSNFIFLIGDCGNHESDPKGYNESKVIDALFDKRVNILAFQANNNYKMASSRFSIQANRIIDGLVSKLSEKAAAPNSIGLRLGKNNLYETYKKGKNELPAFICKYTYSDLNKSKTPEELNRITLKMIEEFDDYIDINVQDIQSQLRGDSPKYPERVLEMLKLAGFTENEINAYIASRKVLKIEGSTSINPFDKGYNIFEPVLFISGEELGSLVKELKRLDSPIYQSHRKAYEDALSNLARAFFGVSDVSAINIDDLFAKLYGINYKPGSFEIKRGNKIVPIKIEWIIKPEIVSDDLLKSLIATFAGRTKNLNFILSKDQSEYKFKSNNIPYYYIPIKELP